MNQSTSSSVHLLNIEMNRVADHILQAQLGLSYSRFYCLLNIMQHGGGTQHDIAIAMGYSDPAISKMLGELSESGRVAVTKDPRRGRRRIVELTSEGHEIVGKSLALLDECFTDAVHSAGIDEALYQQNTQALVAAMRQK